MKPDQASFDFNDSKQTTDEYIQYHHIITDRGSKYSVTAGHVKTTDDVKKFIKRVKSNKKYAKASHNTWAVRLSDNGSITDQKNDDGEAGAGMVILRMLNRENYTNTIVVVTRWFGGTHLGGDRYRHVQDSVRYWLEREKA